MKTIQKNLKAFFVFLAFLACSFLFVLTPLKLQSVKAAQPAGDEEVGAETPQPTFKSLNMPKKVDYRQAGATLKIPFLSDEQNYYIRVMDKDGFTHDYKVTEGEGADTAEDTFFSLVKKGNGVDADYLTIKSQATNTYRIFYIKESNSTLYFSKEYLVEVVGANYGLETKEVVKNDSDYTESNLENLFPSKVDVNFTLTLPTMYGYRETDEGRTYDKAATVSVSLDGNPAPADIFSNGVINFKQAGRYVITYKYQNSSTYDEKSYEIVIEAEDGFVAPDVNKNQVKLPDSIALPTSAKLGDKEVVLPNPALEYKMENFNNSNAAKNVTAIEIKNVDTGISKTLTNNHFTFSFTPGENGFGDVNYTQMEGKYEITYTVKDAYGNQVTAKYDWGRFTKNSIQPNIQAVYDYTAFDAEENFATADSVKSALAEIKAEYDYTATGGLLFPAVYFDSPVDNYTDLMVVRYFQNTETGKRYYIDGVRIDTATNQYIAVGEGDGFNYVYSTSSDTEQTKNPIVANDAASQKEYFKQLSKSAIFKFNKDGTLPNGIAGETFRLCYEVKVKSSHISYSSNSGSYGRQSALYQPGTSNEYTFKIVSAAEKSTNLSVNIINSYASTVYTGNTVRFTVNSSDNKDLRLTNAMYYSDKPFNSITDWDKVLNDAKANYESEYSKNNTEGAETYTQIGLGDDSIINKLENVLKTQLSTSTILGKLDAVTDSNNQFELVVPDDMHGKQLYILAITINDNGNIAVDNSKSVYVANSTDSTAPTVVKASFHKDTDKPGNEEYTKNLYTDAHTVAGQGETVYIPTVEFNDQEDNYLTTSVAYYVIPESGSADKIEDNMYQNQFRYPEHYVLSNKISGYIKTDKVGTYVIVYTATNDAGDTTVVHYSFKVTSTAQPSITVDVGGDGISGTKTDGYTIKVGKTVNVVVHAYDGNDSSKELPHDDKLNISFKPLPVQGKEYENDNGGYLLKSAGKYGFEVDVSWTDEKGTVHTLPTYTFTVTAELDSSDTIVWDSNFTIDEYYSFIAGDNKVLSLPSWTVNAQEGYIYKTALLYKRQGESVWSEATKNPLTGKWEFEPSNVGVYNLSYEAYAIHGGVEYYSHKEKSITYGDNVEPKFSVNNGVLDDKITYNDEDISIQVKLDRSDKIMIITAKSGDKTLYTWTSYLTENEIKNNANFIIIENNEDPEGSPKDNYSWTSAKLSVKLLDSQGVEITPQESTENGEYTYTVYDFTISSTGVYKFKFTAEDSASKVGEYEIQFSVATKTEPTHITDSQIGIILIVVSSIILIGVILFFLFTGKGGKKQKPAALVSETTSTSKKKSTSKKTKNTQAVAAKTDKAEKAEKADKAEKTDATNQDAE